MSNSDFYKNFNISNFNSQIFYNLMKYKVQEILFISSFADTLVLEENGFISDRIFGEYKLMDLSSPPHLTTLMFGDDIDKIIEEQQFDLIIFMVRSHRKIPFELVKKIKNKLVDTPIQVLLNRMSLIDSMKNNIDQLENFDNVFMWNGDNKLFIAMIKSLEDKVNASYDVLEGTVRVILLIENSPQYYSEYLSIIFKEIIVETEKLIELEFNENTRHLYRRSRPKILLAKSYEEAKNLYQTYKEHLLCVIGSASLKIKDNFDYTAGRRLLLKIREENPSLPILLQSSDSFNQTFAEENNIKFIAKYSPNLYSELKDFLRNDLGYGDFIFKLSSDRLIGKAGNLSEFQRMIATVPLQSLIYHGNRNNFSTWLATHGNLVLAKEIRKIKTTDFENNDDFRKFLLDIFSRIRREENRGKIIDFSPPSLNDSDKIILLSKGSLGGKGRGLAFIDMLLVSLNLTDKFDDFDVRLPATSIIGTNEYDLFLEKNNILNRTKNCSDNEISEIFLSGKLSDELIKKIEILIDKMKFPLAVRSSGLLEDSHSQPFAGIYNTFMLPNNHKKNSVRLQQLYDAIKLVFASPFFAKAKDYIESINFKIEEEKMAVIIEQVVGSKDENNLFYPKISGVAQSYNFYPGTLKHEDGITSLAVGLGNTIVDGERNFSYCPKYPKANLTKPEDIVQRNQESFYAIDLSLNEFDLSKGEHITLKKVAITKKMKESSLKFLTSVWQYEYSKFLEGSFYTGPRVLTFRNIIFHNKFPLSYFLTEILEAGELAMGLPVEIEFAVDIRDTAQDKNKSTFYILQIRPINVYTNMVDIDLDKIVKDEIFLSTNLAMGSGIIDNIRDIIFIKHDKFDSTKTMQMKNEIEYLNNKMRKKDLQYILIGTGRWGSSDRFLGIPVKWSNIDHAKIIIEADLHNYMIESSQGSHFFHNVISMSVGYLKVLHKSGSNFIDWNWLNSLKIKEETDFFVHVQLKESCIAKINSNKGIAVIYKNQNS